MLTALVFILLFGALQALLLLAVLLYRKKIQKFHVFLSAYIIVLLLQVTFKVLSKTWLLHTVLPWYILSYYLPFLYGPLALLFARFYLSKTSWRWRQLLHFVPFCIYIALIALEVDNYLPLYLRTIMFPFTRMALQIGSLLGYHYFTWNMLRKTKTGVATVTNEKHRFLKAFNTLAFAITCSVVFALFFLYNNYPHYQDVRWSFITLTFFVYWLSYKTLQQPGLFKVIQGNNSIGGHSYIISALKVHHPQAKYSNSGLKQDEAERIVLALHKSMDAGKLFLDAGLTIDTLAEKLGCQKHHLSQVLNDSLNKSFASFINEKRVEEAKRLLASPNFDHYKISSIAYDAGFNSLSSFNEIFKKSEGVTPSSYRVQSRRQLQPQVKRV